MNNDIIQEAKNRIYNSDISNYISKEKIDKVFENIVLYDSNEKFLNEYGKNYENWEHLEGFNRDFKSYLSPEATVHTVVHEVMHSFSSQFDNDGHRITNGIDTGKFRFENQLNEGVTDYLARKISGEPPRHYIQGNKFFVKFEPLLVKYTKNKNILMES